MRASPILAALLFAAGAVSVGASATEPPPQRFRSQVIYGDDPCPQGGKDEVVVCARQPESDRYRIPKKLRKKRNTEAAAQAWGSRVATLDDVSRVSAGLPNTCSAVGSGGQTGCMRKFLQQYRDEKREQAAEDAAIPGEK